MTRIWDLGNGQKLNDALVPYAYGSNEYYQYIADKRRAAAGDTGPQKSDALTKLEQGLQQDKLAPQADQGEQWWKDAHNANQASYAQQLAAYNEQMRLWKEGGNDFVKGMDHGGQAAAGYSFVPNAQQTGQAASSEGGLDPATAGTYQGLAGYWKSQDPYFAGKGKMGGVGNENPNSSVDNSWNENDGVDPRTAEQKYYDRNLTNVNEKADALGTYHWYGTEVGYDPKDAKATRTLDLTGLGSRSSNPADVDPGKQAGGGDGTPYDYNSGSGYGIQYGDYLNEVRSRKNLSVYGRTA